MSATEAAQRKLLEAIADLRAVSVEDCGESGDPFISLAAGIQTATYLAAAAGQPEVARVYINLGSLVLAVRDDLEEIQP